MCCGESPGSPLGPPAGGHTEQEVATSALCECGSGAPRRRALRGPCLLMSPGLEQLSPNVRDSVERVEAGLLISWHHEAPSSGRTDVRRVQCCQLPHELSEYSEFGCRHSLNFQLKRPVLDTSGGPEKVGWRCCQRPVQARKAKGGGLL
jgi:hypothetical protein